MILIMIKINNIANDSDDDSNGNVGSDNDSNSERNMIKTMI